MLRGGLTFAAADARPFVGPGLKALGLCKRPHVRYSGVCRPRAAERMIRWAART